MSAPTTTRKIFYKKILAPSPEGLEIFTYEWISIHESPCFHFCVPKYEFGVMSTLKGADESDMAYSKRKKILKRISKTNSRFAFDTEQQAIDHLKLLKKRQLAHMLRDTVFIEKFLASSDEEISSGLIPDTKDLVGEHYSFD